MANFSWRNFSLGIKINLGTDNACTPHTQTRTHTRDSFPLCVHSWWNHLKGTTDIG